MEFHARALAAHDNLCQPKDLVFTAFLDETGRLLDVDLLG